MILGQDIDFRIWNGAEYAPANCLISAPLSESVDTIETTTRENKGWKTELPTTHSFSLSLTGVIKYDISGTYFDLRVYFRTNTILKFQYKIGDDVQQGMAIVKDLNISDNINEEAQFTATLHGWGKLEITESIIGSFNNDFNNDFNIDYE